MTKLLKNGKVVNVFTDEVEKTNVLIEDNKIVGVGDYTEADEIIDVAGKFLCPSFIDGHIHIESTMLSPQELARVCVRHGTYAIVADPHEIANVAGTKGISYMMAMSKNLPMRIYYMLPSCVPATPFDENGGALLAKDLEQFYSNEQVLGLAEVMNYYAVINDDKVMHEKISRAKKHEKLIDGHAPLLGGHALDKYIASGIRADHECSIFEEALEKLKKGMWIMIREGTSAQNLEALLGLFDEPYNHRCMLVTDDKHPYDLLNSGHIDAIIRKAVRHGKRATTGIRMASLQAAQVFMLPDVGAIAPGYLANILVLNDIDTVDINDVYFEGKLVCKDKKVLPDIDASPKRSYDKAVHKSFNMKTLVPNNFYIEPKGKRCRIIQTIPQNLITKELVTDIDFEKNNGIDVDRDIVKLAVCERHKNTGHIGLGFINGVGIKKGAIASSVSHDSHNLVIIGANESDMALAGNTVAEMHGGLCVVESGKVLAKLALSVAGLMSEDSAESVAADNQKVRDSAKSLGANEGVEPFMIMSFMALPVIPDIKMTTEGLINVNEQKLYSLFV